MTALSASATQPNDSLDGRYYRLFAPVTFYHSVSQNALSLNADRRSYADQAVDAALMNIYMQRPDLVEATETELCNSGTLRNDLDTPIEQHTQFVEKVKTPDVDTTDDMQVDIVVKKPNFWTRKGDGFLQFMQNYVSDNWYKGGESNYAMLGNLVLEANYDNKSRWKWDNKLELKLGFQRSRSDTVNKFKTNEDLIRLTSKVGLQATKNWYYTVQMIAYTQFTRGLKSNDHKVYSDFMSPFNLNLGLGMDYKVKAFGEKLTGTVNLSPVAVNFRYVDRLALSTSYGLDEGKHTLFDLGSQVTADLEWKMSDNVTWKSRFYTFTSYKRIEVEWENTFALKVSKYITANLFLYPRFDDAGKRDLDMGFWQFKEFSSLGFNYTF